MKQLALGLFLASSAVFANPVDINTADAQTLAKALKGVGPTLAERIVKFRQSEGHFPTPDSIQLVPGVGPSIYGKNKAFIEAKPTKVPLRSTPIAPSDE